MKPNRSHGRTQAQWEAMCLKKRRFPDEYVARAVAQETLGDPASDVDHLFVYRCPNCRGWHLTHKNHGEKAAAVTATDPYKDDRVPKVWKFLVA